MVLVVAAGLAVAFANEVLPGDKDARAHVIQSAARMLVILGAYFTAVNIREARAQQAFDRLCRVIDQLGSDEEAVRIGAVRLLQSISLEVAAEPGERPSTVLAREVVHELEASAGSLSDRRLHFRARLAQPPPFTQRELRYAPCSQTFMPTIRCASLRVSIPAAPRS